MGDPEVHRERPLSRRLVNDTALADALIEQGVCDRDGILHALLTALETFDQDMAARYTDHVLAVLTTAARDHLEALMTTGTYEYKSDYARRYYHKGQTDGRTEGLAEGRAEGLTEGRTEGRAEGL